MIWYKKTAPKMIIIMLSVPTKALDREARKVTNLLPIKKNRMVVTINPTYIPVLTPFQRLSTKSVRMGRKESVLNSESMLSAFYTHCFNKRAGFMSTILWIRVLTTKIQRECLV